MAPGDEGYATPAAAVISLAIAIVATSVTARAVSELRNAKAALNEAQADYRIRAAVEAALVAIGTSDQPPPYRWEQSSLGEGYDVVAEPERAKLSPAAMADLDDATFGVLGVQDPVPVRARLRGVVQGRQFVWLADQAAAGLWKTCAATFGSPYGVATSLQISIYRDPRSGATPPHFRAGEVWRIRTTSPDGWRDERVVQITGDGLTPAVTIDRRFSRSPKGQQACETLLGAPSAS